MNFKLFNNKNFSLFVIAQSTSLFGDIFLNIALSLYVLKTTGSAEKFASILVLGVIPQLILGSFAGTIVDRLNKKKTIVFLDLIRGVFLILLMLMVMQGSLNLGMIYVTVIFFSFCNIFCGPSFITIFPLILNKDELVQGNALKNTIMEATKVAAPVLAALAFKLYGLKVVFLIDAITFFVSSGLELLMVFPKKEKKSEKGKFIKEVIEGFGVFLEDIRITSLVVNGILSHIFLFPFFLIGFPYMLIQVFSVPDVYYGIVESTMPIGFILSAGLVSLTKDKFNVAESINIAIIGMVICVLFVALLCIPSFMVVLEASTLITVIFFGFINFITFLSFGYYGVFFVSFYQENIAIEYLGRFGSILIMLFSIGRLVGFKMFGYFFNHKPIVYPIAILMIGMIMKLIAHIPFMRSQKKIEISSNN